MAASIPINQPLAATDEDFVSRNTVWRRFRKHKLAIFGAIVLTGMILVAILAGFLAPYDPNWIDNTNWQGTPLPPTFVNAAQSGHHALGTDEVGRDLLSRLIFGARISLTVGILAMLMEVIIGTFLGCIAGYYGNLPLRWQSRLPLAAHIVFAIIGAAILGVVLSIMPWHGKPWLRDLLIVVGGIVGLVLGFLAARSSPIGGKVRDVNMLLPVDYLIMRFTDVFLSIPLLPLLLVLTAIVAASSSKASLSFLVIVVIIGALSWPPVARLVRAQFLSLREREFAEAARALGNRDGRIIFRHLLPNAVAPIIVQATLDVANVIIVESTISFLGFGIQPPTASWGNMLSNAISNLQVAWWAAVFPGLCILITVLAINYMGDGLRDALDPNTR